MRVRQFGFRRGPRISRSQSSGRPLRAGPVGSSGLRTKEKGSGTPADALSSVPHQRVRSRHGKVGLRRPVRCRARSPAGVPPRLLPRRVSHPQGATRAMLRGTAASTRRASLRRRYLHFQRCTSRAGHNAGRLMPEPPECAADEATPAGTALAPLRPASPGRRPLGRDLIRQLVSETATIVKTRLNYGDNASARPTDRASDLSRCPDFVTVLAVAFEPIVRLTR